MRTVNEYPHLDLTTYLAPASMAADSTTGGVDMLFAQYGAIGIFAGLALLAVRVLYKHVTDNETRERERADRLEEEVRKLNSQIRDEYMKTLTQANAAMAETNRVVSTLFGQRTHGWEDRSSHDH